MEILSAPARLAAAVAGLAFACAAAAGVPGALFEHGDILSGAPGERILVRDGLLQLELAPGVIASARSGTEFQVNPRPAGKDTLEFTVLRGSVRIVHTADELLVVAGPGRHVLTLSGGLSVRSTNVPRARDEAPALLDMDYRQRVNLADSILLRQNEKLRIDTQTFVQQFFQLFGR